MFITSEGKWKGPQISAYGSEIAVSLGPLYLEEFRTCCYWSTFLYNTTSPYMLICVVLITTVWSTELILLVVSVVPNTEFRTQSALNNVDMIEWRNPNTCSIISLCNKWIVLLLYYIFILSGQISLFPPHTFQIRWLRKIRLSLLICQLIILWLQVAEGGDKRWLKI